MPVRGLRAVPILAAVDGRGRKGAPPAPPARGFAPLRNVKGCLRQPLTSMAARSPSLTRLKQIEVTKMQAPGSTATQGCT